MANRSKKCLMVGLPATGKTTFLAAFWHAIYEPSAEAKLSLKELPSDRQYLEEIRNAWLRFEPIPRTAVSQIDSNRMSVVDGAGNTLDLFFPDLLGEIYQRTLLDRNCSQEFQELLCSSQGLLFFVHPDRLTNAPYIEDVTAIVKLVEPESEGEENNVEEAKQFDVKSIPTDTCIVDLFELLHAAAPSSSPQRVGIVISAWDRAMVEGLSPHAWLEKRVPLLSQFIAAANLFQSKIFGISAQGGRLLEDAAQLKKVMNPVDRIIVQEDGNTSTDITIPIKWLIE